MMSEFERVEAIEETIYPRVYTGRTEIAESSQEEDPIRRRAEGGKIFSDKLYYEYYSYGARPY